MPKKPDNHNKDVTKFLNDLNHPMIKEIEALRLIILSANSGLTENIKWNGPNYCFNDMDRITMRVQPPHQLQLIFHRGSKVLKQPTNKLISDDSGLLSWKGNDRAVGTFKRMSDIQANKSDLHRIVNDWINAAS